ncbi:Rv1733c family protein [Streptacidiphilus sp. PAMC 29251]
METPAAAPTPPLPAPRLPRLGAALARRHNPLLRRTDVLRHRFGTLLLLGLAAAASLSFLLALHIDHDDRAGVQRYTAALRQVQAVAIGDADQQRIAAGAKYVSPVRWTDAAGATHQARAVVPGTADAGSTVAVWLDAKGRPVTPPTSAADSAGKATFIGFLAFLGAVSLITTAVSFGRARLDRADLQGWELDWQRVEPAWTAR